MLKVTAFITRQSQAGYELLLFEHPHAGIRIPAGTVESGESPEAAVMREAAEETGLTGLTIREYLGCAEDRLPQDLRIILEPTKVYARPDPISFDWAYLRRGIVVALSGRRVNGFSQVMYEEFDRLPDPQYVSMNITGWVPDGVLADSQKRHFFHLEAHERSPQRWTVHVDNHIFTLFWAPLTALPKIIHPQDEWLAFLPGGLEPADHGKGGA
jgi:8-oxo-dGTP pyrophosphatase MutT (NUDIX family)